MHSSQLLVLLSSIMQKSASMLVIHVYSPRPVTDEKFSFLSEYCLDCRAKSRKGMALEQVSLETDFVMLVLKIHVDTS